MTAEQTYQEHLETIRRIASFVAHRNHLNPDEVKDFTQEVCLRLLDDDYAIIGKFEGRSSFSTYLTTVIMRLYQQWRVAMWGKWRPSAEAKRLGDKATTLERLMTRDGYTFSEAVSVLTTPESSQFTVEELEAIYIRLPPRNPRPTIISGEVSPDVAAADANAADRVETQERRRIARKVGEALDRKLAGMDAEDRLILQMRFWKAMKVPEIAQRLHLDQKKIYKRLDRLFQVVRRALEESGVSKSDVAALLSSGDQEIRIDPEPENLPDASLPPDRWKPRRGGK